MTLLVDDVVVRLQEFSLEISFETTAPATALYGPSGAGKTTLLEVIAGLRVPERGRVVVDGRVLADGATQLPARARRIGYVPQDSALFPHLSVRRNIFYGASEQARSSPRAARVIEVLELTSLLERGVGKLSGGEKKRVAIARALLSSPDLLLLDEPLAGVDLPLRGRVLEHLERMREEFPVPTIYVTHEMEEVDAICDEIVFLDRGRIVGRKQSRGAGRT